jgi:hypothetical protein
MGNTKREQLDKLILKWEEEDKAPGQKWARNPYGFDSFFFKGEPEGASVDKDMLVEYLMKSNWLSEETALKFIDGLVERSVLLPGENDTFSRLAPMPPAADAVWTAIGLLPPAPVK